MYPKMRRNKNVYIVKLKEIGWYKWHRKFKGSMITINESDKTRATEGEYYKEDLIGFWCNNKIENLDTRKTYLTLSKWHIPSRKIFITWLKKY